MDNSTPIEATPLRTIKPHPTIIPSPIFDSGIIEAERESGNQDLVDSVLMRFDAVRRRLLQINYAKDVVIPASTICKNQGIKTNTKKRIGEVPGVQVGDIFYNWSEMYLVGLHLQTMAGIDYLRVENGVVGSPVSTSVVTSGHYNDKTEDVNSLIYTGHGGKDKNGQPRDQKLERGNLALVESNKIGNEVRVIRGKEDPDDKNKKIYIYDGLYFVSELWKEKGNTGCEEFKFGLMRKQGQPEGFEIWKSAENLWKHGLSNSRKGFILEDLSYGKEAIPVTLVNEVDENDKSTPPGFEYVISENNSNPMLDCVCVQRNEGKLPYHNNILVCRKPMVYECDFSCKNRVLQSGLKIQMEVFKTSNCGWGLRSWKPIRAGTFICEFSGVNKKKEEVEEDDDYLFDSSRIYNRFKWNYEPELLGEDAWKPVSEVFNLQSQVLISAKDSGNVGRFLNHSCSPNVFWQPTKCGINSESHVRIGFFAMKHIPPLTELTYDYGVSSVEKIGEDERLFKGKKNCLCGSMKCRGSFG
ncbi:Histone-lysine N-methyltransferase, H3 lysine-9 specific SUVH8 [Cardamine amara subsp. amara]|uniref:Histone-lysine N-methyltransferase, H3 lysine-9 specific SUVH8 n=1 Tax=Cardamine amara subsp. amara TaxID=228776 RepID=A0ABD0ZVZ9_CARAN